MAGPRWPSTNEEQQLISAAEHLLCVVLQPAAEWKIGRADLGRSPESSGRVKSFSTSKKRAWIVARNGVFLPTSKLGTGLGLTSDRSGDTELRENSPAPSAQSFPSK